MFARFILMAFLSLGLSACQRVSLDGPVPRSLVLQLQVYEDVVRWGDLRKIYAFGRPGEGRMKSNPDSLGNIRVTGYEANQAKELAPWRWGQSAKIAYVLKDRQVVKEILDQQIWVSDNEGESWYRANPVPAF